MTPGARSRGHVATLLVALVLGASLASAAHAHVIFCGPHALAAGPLHAHASAVDFGCALCAVRGRLAHGALPGPEPLPIDTERFAPIHERPSAGPALRSLSRSSPRAPPRPG